MKKTYLILLILSLFISSSVNAKTTVSVEVIHATDAYEKGKSYPFLVKLTVAKGWYIHAAAKEDFLIPTELSFEGSENLKIDSISFPETIKKKFEYTDKPTDVYAETFFIKAEVKVGNKASDGQQLITGNLSYQACSEKSCLAPETIPVEVPVTVVPAGTQTTEINRDVFLESQNTGTAESIFDSGLFWALLWIFLGGLGLNLTPCIFPLIPITISYFGGRGQNSQGNVILSGIFYLLGLSMTYSILGVLAAISGNTLGVALQYPAVLIFIALVMTTLAFSFFGFWEFSLPSGFINLASKNYKGYFGTYFMGLTLGIIAAPCIGPLIITLLLHVGQKGDPFLGFLYFFALSIGQGLPICILAIFSEAISRLPKSGDWMLWVKKVFGWILIGMGYYYIRSLISNTLLEHAMLLGLAIIASLHLGWFDKSGKNLRFFKDIKLGLCCIILTYGIAYLLTAVDLSDSVKWTPYNETLLENTAENSKPVIMDVYADWCGPCKLMDKHVFRDSEVLKLSESFVMVRLDITRKTQNQDEIRKKYSIAGAPTIIFFDKNGNEISELRIESEVKADEFISHMKKAL